MSAAPIIAKCRTLIDFTEAANVRIRSFIKVCSDARRDVLNLYSELCALALALDCLVHDTANASADIADALEKEIISVLGHCGGLVSNIDDAFRDHGEARENAPTEWAWPGKDKTDVLCQFSKSYKCIILLSIGIIQLCAIKNKDADVPNAATQKTNVEKSINDALNDINQLPMSLSDTGLMEQILSIQSHLDSLTLYAKSVTGGNIDPTVTLFTCPPVTSSILNGYDDERFTSQPPPSYSSVLNEPGPSSADSINKREQEEAQATSSSVPLFGPGPDAVTQVRVREVRGYPPELEEQKFVPVASRDSMQALWVPHQKRIVIFNLTLGHVMGEICSDTDATNGLYPTSAKFFPPCANNIFIGIKYRSAAKGVIEIWQVRRDLSLPVLVNTLHDVPAEGSWDGGVRDGGEVLYMLLRKSPSHPLELCVTNPFSGELIETLDEVLAVNPLRPPFIKASATGRSLLLCKHTDNSVQLWTYSSQSDQSGYDYREVQVPHSPETQREISISDTAITLVTPMQIFHFDTTSPEVDLSVNDFKFAEEPSEVIPSSCGSLVLAGYTGSVGSDVIKLWDWRRRELVSTMAQHWMMQWSFSPDDEFLISVCDSKTRLFEVSKCCSSN